MYLNIYLSKQYRKIFSIICILGKMSATFSEKEIPQLIAEPIELHIEEIEQAPINTDVKYNKYLEAQKRANKKYRESHREKFREISRNYYNNHKSDPEFQQRQRDKALKSYHKRKQLKNDNDENTILTINI